MTLPSTRLIPLASGLRAGESAIADYLADLEARFAAREPSLMAFVPEEGRFERLRREAGALLAQYPEPESRPPLFAIPVGVKDIFHVAGFTTRAGSRLPPDELQGPEADCVTALKRAGALILGKTATTEFAYFAPGPTRNPHNPGHTPGGSSSGSAASVAAGLCPLALGTQTIGSIVRPAAFCGVVGFKPSYDRIPRSGVIPLSPSADHVGLFAADVPGGALAAGLLCRGWRPTNASRRPVLGVPEGPYLAQASPEGLEQFRQACERLAAAGYGLIAVEAMADFPEIRERHDLIVAAEAAQVHAAWFARYRELYHAKTAELIERGQRASDEAVARALKGRKNLRMDLTHLMNVHGIDVWLSPGAPGAAPSGLESTGSPVMNLPWTHAGLPSLNVPSGRSRDGLPLGLQLVARWYADELLLAWAEEIRRAVWPEGIGLEA